MESQDKRCGEKRNRKRETEGQRRSPRGWPAFLLTVSTLRIPPSPEYRVLAYLTATSIKAGVGSRMGLPPGGHGVTCRPIHLTWQSQVSSETKRLWFKIGGDSELQGLTCGFLRIVWAGANGQERPERSPQVPFDDSDGVRNARRIRTDEPPSSRAD